MLAPCACVCVPMSVSANFSSVFHLCNSWWDSLKPWQLTDWIQQSMASLCNTIGFEVTLRPVSTRIYLELTSFNQRTQVTTTIILHKRPPRVLGQDNDFLPTVWFCHVADPDFWPPAVQSKNNFLPWIDNITLWKSCIKMYFTLYSGS